MFLIVDQFGVVLGDVFVFFEFLWELGCVSLFKQNLEVFFYQCNGVMLAVKQVKKNFCEIVQGVVDVLVGNVLIEKVEIVGLGFLNLCLFLDVIMVCVVEIVVDECVGVVKIEMLCKVMIDFGGFNVVKLMYVGYLWFFVLGDSL